VQRKRITPGSNRTNEAPAKDGADPKSSCESGGSARAGLYPASAQRNVIPMAVELQRVKHAVGMTAAPQPPK